VLLEKQGKCLGDWKVFPESPLARFVGEPEGAEEISREPGKDYVIGRKTRW